MNQTRKDNIFFRDHEVAFRQAIAQGYLSDNENDSHYAGNFMYMNSEHIESRLDIDYFKNRDTREYLKIHVETVRSHSHIVSNGASYKYII